MRPISEPRWLAGFEVITEGAKPFSGSTKHFIGPKPRNYPYRRRGLQSMFGQPMPVI